MLAELIVETLAPGTAPAYLAHLATAAPAPLGRWTTEFGTLNQVLTLQDAGDGFPAETSGYLARHAALVQARDSQGLQAAKPYRPDAEPAVVFELRIYALASGAPPRFLSLMLEVMPARERHSMNVGVWIPTDGEADRIFHMWAYRDLAHRAEVRADVAQEPYWRDYVAAITPLLRKQTSILLSPVKPWRAAG
jgi:hypothetical protein